MLADCIKALSESNPIQIGVLTSLIASLIILRAQHIYVWSKARGIAGEYYAYMQDPVKRCWVPMEDPIIKAGLTTIERPSFWRGPPNILRCKGSNIEKETQKVHFHVGKILLDAPHCLHGVRGIQQEDPDLVNYVQEIRVLDKDTIWVEPKISDRTPLEQLFPHLLVLQGSKREREIQR